MILVTGDVHHRSLRTRDQSHLHEAEMEIAVRYARLASEAGVPITLFVTGRCAIEHPRALRALAESGAEIGGHTWDAFSPALPRRVLRKLSHSSLHGPALLQRYHMRKTLSALEEISERPVVSWRNHAYHGDANTSPLLRAAGVSALSDEVSQARQPRRNSAGLWSFPINVIPDHEHLLHAHRDERYVARWTARKRFKDAFGSASHPIEDYEGLVREQLQDILQAGGVATLLLHPACMELADHLAFFRRLLAELPSRDCRTMRDAALELGRSSNPSVEAAA